jgi:O-antigen ligase
MNTVITSSLSAYPVSSKSTKIYGIFWELLWFYLGVGIALSLILKDNLYLFSIITTSVNVFWGIVFGMVFLIRPSYLKSSLTVWIALYLLWLTVANILSPAVNSENFLRVWGFLIGKYSLILATIIGFKILRFSSALKRAARGFVGGVFISSLLFATLGLQSIEVTNRLGSSEVINPKIIGQYLSIVIPILVFLPVYRSAFNRYSLLSFLTVLLLATLSKSSIIGTTVGVITGWLLMKRKPVTLLLFMAIGGIAAVVLGTVEQIHYYFNSPLATTLTTRTLIWDVLLDLIEERPLLGFGFGTMKDVMASFTSSLGWSTLITQAHNAFLDSLFSGGYIGLSIFSIMILKILFLILKSLRKLKGEHPSSFMLSILVVLLLRSMVEASLHLGMDFYILILLGLCAEEINRRQNSITNLSVGEVKI